MNRPLILLFLTIVLISESFSQELEKLYTARGYWYEEQNERYQLILNKKEDDKIITAAEEQWFSEYHEYLKEYFSQLSESEKENYFANKEIWDKEQSGIITPDKSTVRQQEIQTGSSALSIEDTIPVKTPIMYNGLYGFLYGIGFLFVIQPEDITAAAIPILSTGIGFLWPTFHKDRYDKYSMESAMWSRHGRFMGSFHGMALGMATAGAGDEDYQGKIIIGAGILGSLAAAEIGYHLGNKLDWPQGKIATFKYYGTFIPTVNFFTLAAFRVDNPHVYGASTLASGALGYWIGAKMYNNFNNTRGDMVALSSLTGLTTLLSLGITDLDQTYELAVPITAGIVGTIAGHVLLKDSRLNTKEGFRITYISGAGAVLGLGFAVLINNESHRPYLIIPALAGGLGWYASLKSTYKNRTLSALLRENQWSHISVDFNPENYLYNKSTWGIQSSNMEPGLPLVGIRLHF